MEYTKQSLLKLILVSEKARAETEKALRKAESERDERKDVLATATQPQILYRPSKHTPETNAKLEDANTARDAEVTALQRRLEDEQKAIQGYKDKLAEIKAIAT
mmetsp:Transcript_17458/g.34307  ORF Transcript_17458/g.34307 Transcript_17458/m.34307 type:complete len:104 (+) Transcript_17458:176-487(+)